MASRTKQKEEARARRLAEEQSRSERARRQRRVRMLSGIVIAAVTVVAILIAVSLGNSGSSGLKHANNGKLQEESKILSGLLTGIPQSGNTLGKATAKVTVTEFGDLECPVCKDFALGAESKLISNDVRSGKVKLVYRSLDTATGNGVTPNMFGPQQAAAIAAGLQGKEWDYVELFYHEQGAEGTSYVTPSYLDGLAQQIPGLNFSKWRTDSQNPNLVTQVNNDQNAAAGRGYNSTPTVAISGPKGNSQPIVGNTDYGTLESAIKQVS
jgi:protein-disulfide isomerase